MKMQSTVLGLIVTFFGGGTANFTKHLHTLKYLYEGKLPFHNYMEFCELLCVEFC